MEDYRINFVREFDIGIGSLDELLRMLETDVINIQKTIDENQKILPLLQLSHYVKYYFVGLFDTLSIIQKRLKDLSEFRKSSQKLPFRVIVKILSYFQIRLTNKSKLTDLYCYFKFDPFRKIFRVFHTSSYAFKKELPIDITTLTLSTYSGSEQFRKYVHKFPNLTHLEIGQETSFPTDLHPQSCRLITHVEVREFDESKCEGLKSCQNLKDLTIGSVRTPPHQNSVFICTDFPKLKELTFYSGEGLNRHWEFHKLISIRKLTFCNTTYAFNRSEMVLLLTSCTMLEEIEIGRYNDGLDFPHLHLFFMYGYSLKRVDFYNLKCNNWFHLNGYDPVDKFKMETIVISSYECEGYYTPIPLFNYACKHFSETLKKFDIYLPREGEVSHTGILDDLSPITRLKKLESAFFSHSLYQAKSSTIPIALDFCCETLKKLVFQSVLSDGGNNSIEERLFLGLNPSKFLTLESIHFENYEGGDLVNCGMDRTFISACLTLPVLKQVYIHGLCDCPNWYELLMIPTMKKLNMNLLEEKLFVDFSVTQQEAETNEKDLKFAESFKIPENNNLHELTIRKGVNYPWSFIYEITKMCKELKNLTLNDVISFKPGGEQQQEKKILEEKFAEMKVYIFKNMASLPNLEEINFNVPNSTMAKREFGRQNMFSFSITSGRFVEHRAKEIKILQKYYKNAPPPKEEEEEETEGEQEEEQEQEDEIKEKNNKKKRVINVMDKMMYEDGGTLLSRKGQKLFSMKSEVEEGYNQKMDIFTHPMHDGEMKEISSIFVKLDTLQIMLLPKPILLRILNDFYELTVKNKHRQDLNIKSLFGYFRWDKDRKIHRVFSCIHFLRCGRKMDEVTQFCKFQSLRFENSMIVRIFDHYRPLGLPKVFKLKKGSTEPFFVPRKNKRNNAVIEPEPEQEQEQEEKISEEELEKRKKLMFLKCFSELESLCFVDVRVTLDFIKQLVNSNVLRSRIKRLEFVYCKLSSPILELFLSSDDDWGRLRGFKIVQYDVNPQLVERLRLKFPCFEHVKFSVEKKKKKKKKNKKKE